MRSSAASSAPAYSSADNEFAETAILAGAAATSRRMAAYTRRDFNELDNQGTNAGNRIARRTAPNPQDGRSDAVLGRIVFRSRAAGTSSA